MFSCDLYWLWSSVINIWSARNSTELKWGQRLNNPCLHQHIYRQMTHFFLHSATHLLITSPLPCSKACSTVYDDTHTHTYTYTSMLAVSFCNMLGCDKAITVRDCAKRDLLTVCNTVCSNYISAHFYVPRIQDAVNYAAITWWNEKWARLTFFLLLFFPHKMNP